MLQRGADVNSKDGLGETPLHYAARYCRVGVAELLLKAGADPNAKNEFNETPLHLTAYGCRQNCGSCPKTAELLLSYGADPSSRDVSGKTPLDVLFDKEHREMMYLLRKC
jgi:ankyrin repeat protein